jgi:serine/threonine protein kinase
MPRHVFTLRPFSFFFSFFFLILPILSRCLSLSPPQVMRGKFVFPDEEWSSISDEAKDFVKKLMSKYPRRRPSAAEALAHPW